MNEANLKSYSWVGPRSTIQRKVVKRKNDEPLTKKIIYLIDFKLKRFF